MDGLGHVADDLHVFLPDFHLHGGRRVAALDHEGHAQAHHAGADDGAVAKQVEHGLRIQPHLARQRDGLGIGHVVDRHQVVGGELHLGAVAECAHIGHVVGEDSQDRFDALERELAAAGKHGPGALFHAHRRAADGAVQHGHADALEGFEGVLFVCDRQGAGFDHDHGLPCCFGLGGEELIDSGAQGVGGGQGHDHDVRRIGHGSG